MSAPFRRKTQSSLDSTEEPSSTVLYTRRRRTKPETIELREGEIQFGLPIGLQTVGKLQDFQLKPLE